MNRPALLDTSVASLLHPRKARLPLRDAYAPDLNGKTLTVSFQSVAELYFWAERNGWGPAARAELDQLVSDLVVIPPEPPLMHAWADVMAVASRAGRRLEGDDGWVVATAVYFGMPLVTHDRDMIGLPIPGLSVITHLR